MKFISWYVVVLLLFTNPSIIHRIILLITKEKGINVKMHHTFVSTAVNRTFYGLSHATPQCKGRFCVFIYELLQIEEKIKLQNVSNGSLSYLMFIEIQAFFFLFLQCVKGRGLGGCGRDRVLDVCLHARVHCRVLHSVNQLQSLPAGVQLWG